MTKREKQYLENNIKWLQKYCHYKKCKRYKECPQDHFQWCIPDEENCKKNLDLNTAIAWKVSDWLKLYLINPTHTNYIELSNILTFSFFIMNYHSFKYQRLYERIKRLYVHYYNKAM